MGRKGNKKRGRCSGVVKSSLKKNVKGGELTARKSIAAINAEAQVKQEVKPSDTPNSTTVDALQCMPWNRASRMNSKEFGREEHAALAEWKKERFGNSLFEEYYQRQKAVPSAEWGAFMAKMAEPLPVTFRVNSEHPKGKVLLQKVQRGKLGGALTGALREWRWRGAKLSYLVRPLTYLPAGLHAYQVGLDRSGIRAGSKKFPSISALQEAMHHGISAGYVVRQEVVSMLPVILLDVQAGDRALDLCAAPGTKTAQLLQAVTWPEVGQDRNQAYSKGLVVANDCGREERIPHLQRLLGGRPVQEQARLVISSDLGEKLPLPCFCSPGLHDGFDRVLVDAPCSGDGTVRKAADVLRRWNPEAGAQLHGVQVALLLRGLRMLRVGGKLVYSTCSLNPVEDEAVVAEALRQARDTVSLVDAASKLGVELHARHGLESWCIADVVNPTSEGPGRLRWHATSTDAQAAGMSACNTSMWPPSEREKQWMQLTHCRRILPHDQDTGGFFLSLFQKDQELPHGVGVQPSDGLHRQVPCSGIAEPIRLASPRLRKVFKKEVGACIAKDALWITAEGEFALCPPELKSLLSNQWPVVSAGAKLRSTKLGSPLLPGASKLLSDPIA